MKRRDFSKATGLAALTASLPLKADMSDRPNVFIIMTDQQFADAMSCRMGNKWINTPNMDQLVNNGLFFERAYCANPICMPSRTCMMSGYYPHQTRVQSNGGSKSNADLNAVSYGQLFKDAGYETAYFGKSHLAGKIVNLDGFGTKANIRHKRVDVKNGQLLSDFLKEKREKPFLLVGSFCNPHNICEWPQGESLPDGDIGTPPPIEELPPLVENFAVPKNETEAMTEMRRLYAKTKKHPAINFNEIKWRQYRWAYYRMIEEVDGHIGRALSALHDSGNYKNTLIVFVSDHGDCHGAHHWDHKEVFYDESARVVFSLTYSDQIKTGVTKRLVNTGIDLLPTICDFAGIKWPGALPGMSLKDSAQGNRDKDPRDYVVVQNSFSTKGKQAIAGETMASGRMLRSKQYKYCLYNMGEQRESLVDMEKDPGELVNLATNPAHASVLNQHRSYYLQWRMAHGDNFDLGSLASGWGTLGV